MASPTFSASLAAGRALFEEGRFHAAHEAWESGWRRTQRSERTVLQVLVLWSAALHHHQNGKELGASRLLTRALERLGELDGEMGGLDLEELREGLVTSLERARAPWSDAARPPWPPSFVGSLDARLDHAAACPYCGEPVMVCVTPEDAHGGHYVEDCPVCCRPWVVNIDGEGEATRVSLSRER
ncbi:MAG: CPXCG motif-containing cysteine-rich protein [Archangium sp.]